MRVLEGLIKYEFLVDFMGHIHHFVLLELFIYFIIIVALLLEIISFLI